MTETELTAGGRPGRHAGLLIAASVLLAAISIGSVPLRYDHGNSGRYLLQVLQAADTELFPGDPVVTALKRFRSLFYDLLAFTFMATEAPPAYLEDVLGLLYAISRIGSVLLAMLFVRALGGDLRGSLLMGIWCCFKKSPPVGGDSLFVNVMHHGSLAFLTGCGAFLAILYGRRLLSWWLLSLTFLIHPLMGLHLAFCMVPAYILADRPRDLGTWVGGGLFAASVAVYAVTMAPPAMSTEEASIFIDAKGGIAHVSLMAQSIVGWPAQGLTVALALLACPRPPGQSRGERLVVYALLSGTAASVALSLASELLANARLVQLQPLRVFVWIHFLAYSLLALATAQELRLRSTRSVLLLAVFVTSLVPTLWHLPVMLIAFSYLVTERIRIARDLVNRVSLAALTLVVALMCCGWLLRNLLGSLETLRNPWPPLTGIFILVWAGAHLKGYRWRGVAAAGLIAGAFAGSALYWHRFYDRRSYPEWGTVFKDRVHADWDDTRRWIAARTPKAARFVVAGGRGNFRTRALRTGLGESMSALAWVDPWTYLHVESLARHVAAARWDGRWDLSELAELAAAWHADFVVTDGSITPASAVPLVRIGDYRVFALDEMQSASADVTRAPE